MAGQGSRLQAAVAPGAPAQAKLPLLALEQNKPLVSILDGFLEACVDDACGLPQIWEGSKSDFSIYDDTEVLGRFEPLQAVEQHAGEHNSPQQQSAVIWRPPVQSWHNIESGAEACVPRALKAARQACCIFYRKQDSKDRKSVV